MEKYWVVKMYVGEHYVGPWFAGELANAQAEEAFALVGSGLGNPSLTYTRDLQINGAVVGEAVYQLEHIEKVELVYISYCEEEIIDTIVNEPPEEEE